MLKQTGSLRSSSFSKYNRLLSCVINDVDRIEKEENAQTYPLKYMKMSYNGLIRYLGIYYSLCLSLFNT